jgi:hypothetical protein
MTHALLLLACAAPLPERCGHWRQRAERLVDGDPTDLPWLDRAPRAETEQLRVELVGAARRRGLLEDDRFPSWALSTPFPWLETAAGGWRPADGPDVARAVLRLRDRQAQLRGWRPPAP